MTDRKKRAGTSPTSPSHAAVQRYPGPRSFEDTTIHHHLFFGRTKEIGDLSSLVQARRTLVLFGKSGLGKTSLIQAGLYPKLRPDGYLPIGVRLNDPVQSPLRAVLNSVEQAVTGAQVEAQFEDCPDLWRFFKQTDFWKDGQLLVPVLVFDQYAEVFTLHDEDFRAALAAELKGLAGDTIPASVRQARAGGETLGFSLQPPELRLLFSLREEYVGSLEWFVKEIPTLLEYRYQLSPLAEEEATLAITAPAAFKDPSGSATFDTPSFKYAQSALDLMLRHLENRRGEVEPFQLQLLCRHAESQVAEHSGEPDEIISVDEKLLGGSRSLEKVLDTFYRQAIRSVPGPWQRQRARKLCENLLNADERRISIDENTVHRQHTRPATLKSLEESRLIRKDARPGLDGFYYELSHDSIGQAVAKSRRIRRRIQGSLLMLVVLGLALFGYLQTVEVGNQTQTAENRLEAYRKVTKELYLAQGAAKPELVRIPQGCFQMGSESGDTDERPVHEVCIDKPFFMGKHEVTFHQYDRFAAATDKPLPQDYGWGREDRPVVGVSQPDAVAFADWLNAEGGQACRLPSEAEWEYAARAGTTAEFALPAPKGSDNITGLDLANCDGCDHKWGGKQSAPVGSFPANAWGLHDMHGNVWEWTLDCWHGDYQGAPKDGSPWTPTDGGNCNTRVLRGGSWVFGPAYARSGHRNGNNPDYRSGLIGFRLVCSGPY